MQFVQKDLIPVHRNDLIGMSTLNCGPNAKHIVSAESHDDDPKHAFKRTSITKAGVETLEVNTFNDSQRLRVSLQAFVAGW